MSKLAEFLSAFTFGFVASLTVRRARDWYRARQMQRGFMRLFAAAMNASAGQVGQALRSPIECPCPVCSAKRQASATVKN